MTERTQNLLILGVVSLILAGTINSALHPDASEAVTEDNQTRVLRTLHDALERQQTALKKVETALHLRAIQTRAIADTAHDPGTQVIFLRQACSAFSEEALTCQERAAILAIRNDTLESALRRQIGVSECRIIVLKCPSRLQSLAFGLLLGGAGGIVLAK